MGSDAMHKSAALATFSKIVDEIESPVTKAAANMVRSFVSANPLNTSTLNVLQFELEPLFEDILTELRAGRDADNKILQDVFDAHAACYDEAGSDTWDETLNNLTIQYNDHRTEREEELAAQTFEAGGLDGQQGCGPVYSWYHLYSHDPCTFTDGSYQYEAELTVLEPHAAIPSDPPFLTNHLNRLHNKFLTAHSTLAGHQPACEAARADLAQRRTDASSAQSAFTGAYCTAFAQRHTECDNREDCYSDERANMQARVSDVTPRCDKRPVEYAGVVLIQCFINKIIDYTGDGPVDEGNTCMDAYTNRGNTYTTDPTNLGCTFLTLGPEEACDKISREHKDWWASLSSSPDPCDLPLVSPGGCDMASWKLACVVP